jgi:FkbM family methyltransferase
MDPTAAAAAYVGRLDPPPRFHFLPFGIWSEDTTLRFFAPAEDEHASWSALNLQHTDRYVEAPVRSLRSVMAELGHDRIDLLKLDVEGAEYPVVHQLLDERIPVRVLCLELHPTRRPWAPPWLIARLQRRGYRAVDRTDQNFTFIAPA